MKKNFKKMWSNKDRREYFWVALICLCAAFLLGAFTLFCFLFTVGSGENLYSPFTKIISIFGWSSLVMMLFMAVSTAQAFTKAFSCQKKKMSKK